MSTSPPDSAVPPVIPTSRFSRWFVWLLLAVGMGALLVFALFDPEQYRFFPRCVFHELTGLNCPGCGGLRALHHLLHGELALALRYNLLFVALLPLGAWTACCWIVRLAFRRELPDVFAHHYWPWVLVVAVIGFGILRNLPFVGFAWLNL
jgi:hypothetical protein